MCYNKYLFEIKFKKNRLYYLYFIFVCNILGIRDNCDGDNSVIVCVNVDDDFIKNSNVDGNLIS